MTSLVGNATDSISGHIHVYLQHLDLERGVSANTLAAYRRDLQRYSQHLHSRGITNPTEITQAVVRDFVAVIRTGEDAKNALTASSTARALVAVRGLHRFWLAEGITTDDPAAGVPVPGIPQRLPKAISLSEVEALLAAASLGGTPASLRDRALLEFLYGSGARISEATGLDIDDLDLEAGLARLRGKGSKERLVPVGSYTVASLQAYLVRVRPQWAAKARSARGGVPAVFLNQRGGRLSRQAAWNVLSAAAQRANVAHHVSPHTLRHSFATHLIEGGADVRVVQELLGHASVTTTQVYTKVTADMLREVYVSAHPRALH